jgi:hypothetical protein
MMKQLMMTIGMMLVFFTGAALAGPANGVQAIGFANWTEADVRELAEMYVKAGSELELSFLPNEFNPGNPYGNATRFVQAVLPQLNGRLTVTVYLYFHDYSYQERFDWGAFRRGGTSAFRGKYLRRVAGFDAWAGSMKSWAAQQRLDRKLNIVLCPFLEDDSPSAQAYGDLVRAISQQQQADRVRTRMRRSCLENNIFRVSGLSLEIHGPYASAGGQLRNGDAYSNDGTVVPINQFLADQRQARSRGVSALYWAASYNGLDSYSRGTPPSQRRRLTPLTGSNAQRERDAIARVLRNR